MSSGEMVFSDVIFRWVSLTPNMPKFFIKIALWRCPKAMKRLKRF